MSDNSNIELTLKHFINHFDKSNEAMNLRLDKISTSFDSRLDQINNAVNELTGQKIIIHQMEKRITNLEDEIKISRDDLMILKHDAKKRDDRSNTITTTLMQKGIWAAICCIFLFIAGYGIKGINVKSKQEMIQLMKN